MSATFSNKLKELFLYKIFVFFTSSFYIRKKAINIQCDVAEIFSFSIEGGVLNALYNILSLKTSIKNKILNCCFKNKKSFRILFKRKKERWLSGRKRLIANPL
jgi:hypothetical protein